VHTIQVHVQVRGRVQGVGFRAFVLREARARGVAGRVRNRDDGAVEIDAEGGRDTLEQLLEAVRRGSVGSQVVSLQTTWNEGPARYRGFVIDR
jgi:acylphosphatase